MKEIKAIIRPNKLLEVIEALQRINCLPGATLSEITGFGKNRTESTNGKIIYEKIDFVPRTKLEVVVSDEMADQVVNTIQKFAYTGNFNDGKIFISHVENVLKIRTNEQGEIAL